MAVEREPAEPQVTVG